MDEPRSFLELIGNLCERQRMYVCGHSYYEVCDYIRRYSDTATDSPLSEEGWFDFNMYVCALLGFSAKYAWPFVVFQCARDDDEATAWLQQLLTDFTEGIKTASREEVVWQARRQAKNRDCTAPVQAWRALSRALHRASRQEIESLIQSHPDADVLWSATSPKDAVPLLDYIQKSYLIREDSGSEESGEVTVSTPDFGCVEVKRIDGQWRVNASRIIERWKASSDKTQ